MHIAGNACANSFREFGKAIGELQSPAQNSAKAMNQFVAGVDFGVKNDVSTIVVHGRASGKQYRMNQWMAEMERKGVRVYQVPTVEKQLPLRGTPINWLEIYRKIFGSYPE